MSPKRRARARANHRRRRRQPPTPTTDALTTPFARPPRPTPSKKLNREWAATQVANDPEFFERLLHQQNPDYLWIGCSDSRVPVS